MSNRPAMKKHIALYVIFILLFIDQSSGFAPSRIQIVQRVVNHKDDVNKFLGINLITCSVSRMQLSSSVTAIMENRNNDENRENKELKGLKPPSIFVNTVGIFLVGWCLKLFTRKWLAIKAGQKFLRAGGWRGIYATIPLLSGLINMATNKLAVWMIFSPLDFKGNEWLPRKEGQPGTLFGWQGIVPAKVKKMGGDIADTLLNELLDLKAVFSRIDSAKLSTLLVPKLYQEIDLILKKEVFGDEKKDFLEWNVLYERFLRSRTEVIVKRLIDKIKLKPLKFMDIKKMVVADLVGDKKLIVELFQKCGRDELKFIVTTGLWGGMFLGLFQMAVWLVWDPWWSLALGGAIVGYLTDWFALKIMFEPVEPRMIGPIKIQGLFLQRQEEVSKEFSAFMTAELLTPKKIWNEITFGSRSAALRTAITEELRDELSLFFYRIESTRWAVISERIAMAIPEAALPTYPYIKKTLDLEESLRAAMMSMSSAQFEKVLHPVFQEDEATLIGVGAVLGAVSGLAQVPFY